MEKIILSKGQTFHAKPGDLEKDLSNVNCPSCKKKTNFEYIGEITSKVLKKREKVYNCKNCNSTRSLRDIMKYNQKKE